MLGSHWHWCLLLSFFYGACLAALLHALGDHIVAVSIDVATLSLLVLLSKVAGLHESIRLEHELEVMAAHKLEMEQDKSSIDNFIDTYDRVCRFWQQTMNKL